MLVVAVMVFTGCLRGSPVDEGGVGPTVETAEVDVPMPTLPLPPSVPLALDLELKTFVLSWPAVDDAIGTTVRERLTRDGGFTDIARLDPAVTELSHPVPVFARLQAAYMVEVCNASGCTDSEPRTVPPDLAEAIGFVKAPLPGDNDLFGRSVALSADGSTLAVGAPEADGPAPGLFNNGAVFVYVRAESEGAWTLQHVLRADPAEGSDMFGQAMDISADGSVVVAGARFESTGPTSNSEARNSGAAYIFERDANGSWEQKAFLKAMNASPEDLFGWDVAVSGDGATVAVTATNEDSSVNGDDASMEQNVGAAYVFERIQSSHWEQTAFVKASNAESFDFFGTSVDLDHDGDRLLVGANRESGGGSGVNPDGDGNSADQSGAAYLFFRNSDWEERAYLKARSPQEGARFGDEVALSGSGTVAVVGGPSPGHRRGVRASRGSVGRRGLARTAVECRRLRGHAVGLA